MSLLEFIFNDFWHFIGTVILLDVVTGPISKFIKIYAIRKTANIINYKKICEHDFIADTQITTIKCTKCGEKYNYKIGDIFKHEHHEK